MTRFSVLFILIGFLLTACEDAHLGPDLRGTIEGEVFDLVTGDAVANAGVTTTPPTTAAVTDADGQFVLADVPTGSYSIRVSPAGYAPATVSVTVDENQITAVAMPLEKSDDFAARHDSLEATIINWSNRTIGQDSTVVDVEYRIRNAGAVDLRAYEVYLRIETNDGVHLHEVSGDTLRVQQSDVGEVSKFIRSATAQDILVEGTWTDPLQL